MLRSVVVPIAASVMVLASCSSDDSESRVVVPDVVGRQFDSAQQTLEDEGLRVTVVENVSDDFPVDRVVHQVPLAGDEVQEGTTIELMVVTGPATQTSIAP